MLERDKKTSVIEAAEEKRAVSKTSAPLHNFPYILHRRMFQVNLPMTVIYSIIKQKNWKRENLNYLK